MLLVILRAAPTIAVALCACALVGLPDSARSEPRFGDSTWVAPVEIEGLPEGAGPRVAKPDHDRAWEVALRAPFRAVFFPVRLLARGIEASGGMVEKMFPPGPAFRKPTKQRGLKFSPELIGAKVSYQQFAGPGSNLSLLAVGAPWSNRKVRLRGIVGDGVSPIGFGGEALYDYRPTRAFWGVGNFSNDRKTYYLRETNAATVFAFTGKDHLRRARVTVGLSDMKASPGDKRTPRAVDVFDPADVPFLTQGSKVWLYGARADFASLDDSLSPALGFHLRPEVVRYRSTDDSNLRYDEWRFEARGYVPVFAKRRVLVGRLVYEGVDPHDGSAPIPFYRLPESADEDRFAAYRTGRFRDRRLAVGRVEYRWEIMRPIWAVALGELGEVAPSSSQLTLRGAHPSIGGGLRAKIGDQQAGRLEIARGHEGWTERIALRVDF